MTAIICPQIHPPSLLLVCTSSACILIILHPTEVSSGDTWEMYKRHHSTTEAMGHEGEHTDFEAWLILTCCCDVEEANEFTCTSVFFIHEGGKISDLTHTKAFFEITTYQVKIRYHPCLLLPLGVLIVKSLSFTLRLFPKL